MADSKRRRRVPVPRKASAVPRTSHPTTHRSNHFARRSMGLPNLPLILSAVAMRAAHGSSSSSSSPIPRVEVAPGVELPMLTMGGVVQEGYPDPSNYSLWLELGGRGFDSAWEYQTEKSIAAAIRASGLPRSEIFITRCCGNQRSCFLCPRSSKETRPFVKTGSGEAARKLKRNGVSHTQQDTGQPARRLLRLPRRDAAGRVATVHGRVP
jgi:hypothetical protein